MVRAAELLWGRGADKGKKRDDHPDAKKGVGKSIGEGSGGDFVLKNAKVVTQPGDGNCLFHSLCYGLGDNSTASGLRRAIAKFVEQNPGAMARGTQHTHNKHCCHAGVMAALATLPAPHPSHPVVVRATPTSFSRL